MPFLNKLSLLVRKALVADGTAAEVEANSSGMMRSVQGLPERTELARMGQGYSVTMAAANAFTYVAALPTTLANLYLFNNNGIGGPSYIIDTVFLYGVTSMAAAQPVTQLAQVIKRSAAVAPTNSLTTSLINSLSGSEKLTPAGLLKSVADTKAVGAQWVVIGPCLIPAPTTNLGVSLEAQVFGRFIVPPQCGFAVNAVAGTAAGTAIQGVTFYEHQLDVVLA